VRLVPGSERNWIALMQFNNPASTKEEKQEYDNSTKGSRLFEG
jgi:hypothetical protein